MSRTANKDRNHASNVSLKSFHWTRTLSRPAKIINSGDRSCTGKILENMRLCYPGYTQEIANPGYTAIVTIKM